MKYAALSGFHLIERLKTTVRQISNQNCMIGFSSETPTSGTDREGRIRIQLPNIDGGKNYAATDCYRMLGYATHHSGRLVYGHHEALMKTQVEKIVLQNLDASRLSDNEITHLVRTIWKIICSRQSDARTIAAFAGTSEYIESIRTEAASDAVQAGEQAGPKATWLWIVAALQIKANQSLGIKSAEFESNLQNREMKSRPVADFVKIMTKVAADSVTPQVYANLIISLISYVENPPDWQNEDKKEEKEQEDPKDREENETDPDKNPEKDPEPEPPLEEEAEPENPVDGHEGDGASGDIGSDDPESSEDKDQDEEEQGPAPEGGEENDTPESSPKDADNSSDNDESLNTEIGEDDPSDAPDQSEDEEGEEGKEGEEGEEREESPADASDAADAADSCERETQDEDQGAPEEEVERPGSQGNSTSDSEPDDSENPETEASPRPASSPSKEQDRPDQAPDSHEAPETAETTETDDAANPEESSDPENDAEPAFPTEIAPAQDNAPPADEPKSSDEEPEAPSLKDQIHQEVDNNKTLKDRIAQAFPSNATNGRLTEKTNKILDTIQVVNIWEKNALQTDARNKLIGPQKVHISQTLNRSSCRRLARFLVAEKLERSRTRMPDGKINFRYLPQLATGNGEIYTQKHKPPRRTAAIIALLDFSGSMKMDSRLETALNLCPGLASLATASPDINISIMGYTDTPKEAGSKETSTLIQTLTDFKSPPTILAKSLQRIAAHGLHTGATPTGEAIMHAIRLLAPRQDTMQIILLLTDGKPNNQANTEAAIRMADSLGIMLITIEIGNHNIPQTRNGICETASSTEEIPVKIEQALIKAIAQKKRPASKQA